MSGLIEAMDEAMYQAERIPEGMARAAALAAAVWFQGHGHAVGAWAADMIRAEVDRDVSLPPADDLAGPAHGVVTVERTPSPAAEEARRVEQALLDRILFIAGEGEGIPVLRNDVVRFVLMGTPRELIDELAAGIALGGSDG